MVSSGVVSGDLNSLTSALSKYSSEMSGLSSVWKGTSHDNLLSRSEEFVSEYNSVLSGQMNAFASACDLYQQYVTCKKNIEITRNNYNMAVNSNDSSNVYSFGNQLASYQSKLSELKSQIDSYLSTASSTKLEATTSNYRVVAGANNTFTIAAGGSNPNLLYSSTGYVFPFAKDVSTRVSSHVGLRNAPTAGASTNHKGTDIAASKGTEIHAIYGGTVVQAGRNGAGGYGNLVKIQQDDGYIVTYGHVSKSDYYSVGDRVEAGDLIALVGSEGVSTGPHLHLQVNDSNGNVYDSEKIMQDIWPV